MLATDIIQVIMMYSGLLLVIFRVSICNLSTKVYWIKIRSYNAFNFRAFTWWAALVRRSELRMRMDEFSFSSRKYTKFQFTDN